MSETYRVNLANLRILMKTINRIGFDGDLDLDKLSLVVEDMDTELGYCIKEEGDVFPVLGVCDTYKDHSEFKSTLAHEMIHLYQYQILNMEPNHKKHFIEFAEELSVKIKIPLSDLLP